MREMAKVSSCKPRDDIYSTTLIWCQYKYYVYYVYAGVPKQKWADKQKNYI